MRGAIFTGAVQILMVERRPSGFIEPAVEGGGTIRPAGLMGVALAWAHSGLQGSAQNENPTKAITTTLRMIIAIAATSKIESRLRSNEMRC